MLNLKKTAVAVVALGSSAVFAGTMGPVCSAVNVTVPCESTAFTVGGKALYLQSNLGTERRTLSVGPDSDVLNVGNNTQYGWGFFVEGAYHFNTGNDVNLNWYHISNGRTKTRADATSTFIDPIAGVAATVAGSDYVKIDPKWDAVNLEFGQHVDFGENKSIRFHGGFEYARLTGDVTVANIFNSVVNEPSYNGFGPRAGADMMYDFSNGLSMYGNAAAGLLAGSRKVSTTSFAPGPLSLPVTVSSSSVVVVPELEGKLGLTYDYATAQGDLTLDAGWMWINYFNPIAQHSYDTTKGTLPSAQVADFGLEGPYIGLKFTGNVA